MSPFTHEWVSVPLSLPRSGLSEHEDEERVCRWKFSPFSFYSFHPVFIHIFFVLFQLCFRSPLFPSSDDIVGLSVCSYVSVAIIVGVVFFLYVLCCGLSLVNFSKTFHYKVQWGSPLDTDESRRAWFFFFFFHLFEDVFWHVCDTTGISEELKLVSLKYDLFFLYYSHGIILTSLSRDSPSTYTEDVTTALSRIRDIKMKAP